MYDFGDPLIIDHKSVLPRLPSHQPELASLTARRVQFNATAELRALCNLDNEPICDMFKPRASLQWCECKEWQSITSSDNQLPKSQRNTPLRSSYNRKFIVLMLLWTMPDVL